MIEKGWDVETLAIGALVSMPFKVARGRCRTCREQQTGVCLTRGHGTHHTEEAPATVLNTLMTNTRAPGVRVLGGDDDPPSPRALLHALRYPDRSVVIDLSYVVHHIKLEYIGSILPTLSRIGRSSMRSDVNAALASMCQRPTGTRCPIFESIKRSRCATADRAPELSGH